MSAEEGKRKLTPAEEETDRVKNLIGKCLVLNLNPKEVIDVLYKQEKIEHSFTKTVWQELEARHKKFFDKYYSRLIMKELHKKQAEMTNQSNILPINFDHGALSCFLERVSTRLKEEMQMVKNLIEQCLVHYMNKEQAIDILYQKENISHAFTTTVWQHLEEQNQEFFKNYYLRLSVMDQTIKFNNLVERQAALMNQLYHPNEVTATMNQKFNVPETATALELDINRHRLGILGLQFQVPLSSPPAISDQQSGTS